MVVTLTISDGTVFTFNPGDVKNISIDLTADLDFDSMPQSLPKDAMLFDMNGVKKVINISGELQDTNTNRVSSGTVETINQQRQWLEKNLNGDQGGTLLDAPYTSSWNGTTWVVSPILFSSIRFNAEEGNPEGLPFQITLFVGDV